MPKPYLKYNDQKRKPPFSWDDQRTLRIKITDVIWCKKGNDWAIAIADILQDTESDNPLIRMKDWTTKVVGQLPDVSIGSVFEATLSWEFSVSDKRPEWSEWQLKSHGAFSSGPTTASEIEEFLKEIKFIGPTRAKKLVTTFGTGVLESLADRPRELLSTVLGKTQLEEAIVEVGSVLKNFENAKVLSRAGIDGLARTTLMTLFKNKNLLQEVRADPLLVLRVDTVTFERALKLWTFVGLTTKDPRIIGAAAAEVVGSYSAQGHCWMPANTVFRGNARNKGLVGWLGPEIEGQWFEEDLANHPDVNRSIYVDEYGNFWKRSVWEAENRIVERIDTFLTQPPMFTQEDIDKARSLLTRLVEEEKIRLSDNQFDAVMMCLTNAIVLVTGSAGTGKTTIQKALVMLLHKMNQHGIMVAAPTGKAANNATQKIGLRATTIHKMLGYAPGNVPTINADDPLDAQFFIIDEFSMNEVVLTDQLMQAIPYGAHLILVGDPQQLPAVGPGKVLADLLSSGAVPNAHLTQVFRQQDGSRLLDLCYKVLEDHPKRINFFKSDGTQKYHDIEAVPLYDAEDILKWIVNKFREGADPDKFKIVSYTKGVAVVQKEKNERRRYIDGGVNSINQAVTRFLYGNQQGEQIGDFVYYPGMHCLWLRNTLIEKDNGQLVLDMVNGQDFYIEDMSVDEYGNPQWTINTKDAYGSDVTYQFNPEDFKDGIFFNPGYSMTVHKSQGSGYDEVVFVIKPGDENRLTRATVYTAITRAVKKIYIVGNVDAIYGAPARDLDRNTRLADKLKLLKSRKETTIKMLEAQETTMEAVNV